LITKKNIMETLKIGLKTLSILISKNERLKLTKNYSIDMVNSVLIGRRKNANIIQLAIDKAKENIKEYEKNIENLQKYLNENKDSFRVRKEIE